MKKLYALIALVSSSLCIATPILSIAHWQTANGVGVYFVKNTHLPMAIIQTSFRAGSAYDGRTHGLASLTGAMLNQGSSTLNANQIADQFDDVGAHFGVDVSQDASTVSLESVTLGDALNKAFHVYLNVLAHPSFPSNAFSRLQEQQLQGLKYQLQQPGVVAYKAFLKAVYGNSPYGYSVLGTQKGVALIEPNQLKHFYDQYYVAQNAVVVIEGDVNKSSAQMMASDIADNLRSGQKARVPYYSAQDSAQTPQLAVQKHLSMPVKQTTILMGVKGLAVGDPDYYAASVGNWILGGGQSSLLYRYVRSNKGLAYSVGSGFKTLLAPGPFMMSAQTRNQDADKTTQLMRNTLSDFVFSGPTGKALKLAKNHLLGAYPLVFDSNEAIASLLTKMAFYDLPLDYFDQYPDHIKQLNTKQIQQVMNKIINLDQLAVITVGASK